MTTNAKMGLTALGITFGISTMAGIVLVLATGKKPVEAKRPAKADVVANAERPEPVTRRTTETRRSTKEADKTIPSAEPIQSKETARGQNRVEDEEQPKAPKVTRVSGIDREKILKLMTSESDTFILFDDRGAVVSTSFARLLDCSSAAHVVHMARLNLPDVARMTGNIMVSASATGIGNRLPLDRAERILDDVIRRQRNMAKFEDPFDLIKDAVKNGTLPPSEGTAGGAGDLSKQPLGIPIVEDRRKKR